MKKKTRVLALKSDAFEQRLEAAREAARQAAEHKTSDEDAPHKAEVRRIVEAMMLMAQHALIETAKTEPSLKEISLSERTLLGRARDLLGIDDDDPTGFNENIHERFAFDWNGRYGDLYVCTWVGSDANHLYRFRAPKEHQ